MVESIINGQEMRCWVRNDNL